jgi:hypothetical protein
MTAGMPPDPFANERARSSFNTVSNNDAYPGIATELADAATAALDTYAQHVDQNGVLRLGGFDHSYVELRRIDQHRAEGPVTYPQAAVGGLFRWFRRRRDIDFTEQQYTIVTGRDNTQAQLNGTVYPQHGNDTHFSGTERVGTPEGTIENPLTDIVLEEAVHRATHLLQNGLPYSADGAAAERQNQPVDTVIGEEAMGLHDAVTGLLESPRRLGSRRALRQSTVYRPLVPMSDGQWSVDVISQTLHASGWQAEIPVEGRAITTNVVFSDDNTPTIEGRQLGGMLRVQIQAVYGRNHQPAAAQVRYFVHEPGETGGSCRPIDIGPEGRTDLHQAIMNQLYAGNFYRTS